MYDAIISIIFCILPITYNNCNSNVVKRRSSGNCHTHMWLTEEKDFYIDITVAFGGQGKLLYFM
jgi:hypothetical protein